MSYLTIYNASAGSGKTFTIAAEYISLLLSGESNMHRRILAVTFTNKATEEMKERILHHLQAMAHMDSMAYDAEFVAAVRKRLPEPMDDATLQQRAARALAEILHDYDHFRVETIDSFFQWLLACLAHELGQSAHYKVDLNEALLIEKAVDNLIADTANDKRVRARVIQYIEDNINDDRTWDIRRELRALAGQLRNEEFQKYEEELREVLHGEGADKIRSLLLRTLSDVTGQLEQATSHFVQIIEENGGYDDFSRLKSKLGGYVDKLQKGKYEPPTDAVRKLMVCSPLDEDEDSVLWLKKGNRKYWDDIRPRGENIRQGLIAMEQLRVNAVSVANTCRLILSRFNPLCLLQDIAERIDIINAESGRILLAKTPRLFFDLVRESDAPFVFERAGTTFDHVLIDEFQDTSQMQWQNFRKLLINNLSQGGRCMLVGDVKQSIYRFRGGDYHILYGVKKEMAHMNPKFEPLNTNYRSAQEIIAFNNAFFPRAAALLTSTAEAEGEDAQPSALPSDGVLQGIYASQQVAQGYNKRTGGHVWVEAVAPQPKEEEPKEDAHPTDSEAAALHATQQSVEERLYETICGLHEKGLPYHEMTILVRRKVEAQMLLRYFTEHHREIPLTSDEAFLLSASHAVQTIIHTLRILNDPKDQLARSYITEQEGCTAAELDELLAVTRKIPLYECCQRIIARCNLGEKAEEAPYLMAFMDQLMGFLDSYPADLATFLQYWEERMQSACIQGGAGQGISIMTIHKSKGLDFHTVLMPYVDWAFESDRTTDIIWTHSPRAPFNSLPLVPIPAKNKKIHESDFSDAYDEEHLQQRIENLNLLYVAFTRPRYNLYLWYKLPAKAGAISTAGELMHAVAGNVDENVAQNEIQALVADSLLPAQEYTTEPTDSTSRHIPFRNTRSRASFLQSNASRDYLQTETTDAPEQMSYIDRGKMLHAVLAEVRVASDVQTIARRFANSGILPPGETAESITAYLSERMERVSSYGWFEADAALRRECPILFTDSQGEVQHLRPDRVILHTDSGRTAAPEETAVTIVDYKFGHYHSPDTAIGWEYHEQVGNYARLLSRMGYQHIEGYLWFVDADKVEAVALSGGDN